MDSEKRGYILRKKLIKENNILVVDFTGTLEGKDSSKIYDLFPNVNTGDYIFRTKVDVKEVDPQWRAQRNLEPFDFSDEKEIIRCLNKEFDMPVWFLRGANKPLSNIADYNLNFIYQVKGCNFHDGSKYGGCKFCYVDNISNNGSLKGGTYISVEDIIDSFVSARSKFKVGLNRLRTSGGEPTLILDHILELMEKLAERGLDTQLQSDTNLSTGKLIEKFEENGIYQKNILERLAEFPVKILAGGKGSDTNNIMENIQADSDLETQTYSLKKLIKAGLDVYLFLYNPNPETLKDYMLTLDRGIENIIPRTHIGLIKIYSPTAERLKFLAEKENKDPAEFIEAYKNKLEENYKRSVGVMENLMMERYGVGYKEILRPDVELKIRS